MCGRCCCYFTLQNDLLWSFYDIELEDQEFSAQFISIDILWACRLHIVPLWRKQSMASAFLCGPTVFCRTGSVFATHVPVQPQGALCTQLWRCTQGENVVEMLLTHLFCSRSDRGGEEGVASYTAEPQMSRRGAAHYCHRNPASVIFDSEQPQRLWWDPSHLLSALQVVGNILDQIVVCQLCRDCEVKMTSYLLSYSRHISINNMVRLKELLTFYSSQIISGASQ